MGVKSLDVMPSRHPVTHRRADGTSTLPSRYFLIPEPGILRGWDKSSPELTVFWMVILNFVGGMLVFPWTPVRVLLSCSTGIIRLKSEDNTSVASQWTAAAAW